jgi:hypothetical protein
MTEEGEGGDELPWVDLVPLNEGALEKQTLFRNSLFCTGHE